MRVWRAHLPDQRFSQISVLRMVLVWIGVCFFVFMVVPYWRLKGSSVSVSSCPPCDCHCSSVKYQFDPSELVDNSFADCGESDPVVNEEMKKDLLTLLSEELHLQKVVAYESLEHSKKLVMAAKTTSSHYQKESEKCNLGVETCEEARERAEAELVEERRLSELWERRARRHGWKQSRPTH